MDISAEDDRRKENLIAEYQPIDVLYFFLNIFGLPPLYLPWNLYMICNQSFYHEMLHGMIELRAYFPHLGFRLQPLFHRVWHGQFPVVDSCKLDIPICHPNMICNMIGNIVINLVKIVAILVSFIFTLKDCLESVFIRTCSAHHSSHVVETLGSAPQQTSF